MSKICFIGGGNMAQSLIGGMLQQGFSAQDINAVEPNDDTRTRLTQQFGIQSANDIEMVKNCEIVVLAVKPQHIGSVLGEYGDHIKEALIISIAAGITCDFIRGKLGKAQPIVRAMPNTPALLQLGATGLYANHLVSPAQRQITENILTAVGICAWLEDEAQLDAITGLSGSGPAYFFAFIEALIAAGINQGLPAELCRDFAVQTALGAASMAKNSDIDIATLRENVTSKGGTTFAALNRFRADNLDHIVANAVAAATSRAQELAHEAH